MAPLAWPTKCFVHAGGVPPLFSYQAMLWIEYSPVTMSTSPSPSTSPGAMPSAFGAEIETSRFVKVIASARAVPGSVQAISRTIDEVDALDATEILLVQYTD